MNIFFKIQKKAVSSSEEEFIKYLHSLTLSEDADEKKLAKNILGDVMTTEGPFNKKIGKILANYSMKE